MASMNPKARVMPDGFLHLVAAEIVGSLMESVPYHKYLRQISKKQDITIDQAAVFQAYIMAEFLFAEGELHES